ncbi:hypothetical protein LshimejAT787_0803340 [Lyophyllum shimeji]|uniref:DUF6593 domain-containing protein n=1 Tax=Lyophyllum shimeji TaxID=47721 RepID=A0A9P3UPA2_LYOSH|nr:hypothetical protein LshimejAT787_0803340 [Lyophyllum shimeji]
MMSESNIYELVFETDNPCNTTIVDSDTGKVVYQVATEHGKETVTRVKNAAGETIASWVWKDVRSDIITLGNLKPVPVSAWLKKSLVPFKDTVTLQDGAGRNFKWKGNAPGLSFELYAEDDKEEPVVRFHKSRTVWDRAVRPPTSTVQPARLVVNSRWVEIQDIAVVSFLVLEKSRRARENSTLNRADSLALAPAGLLNLGGVQY